MKSSLEEAGAVCQRLRKRLDKALAGQRVELHVDLDDMTVLLTLAEFVLQSYADHNKEDSCVNESKS